MTNVFVLRNMACVCEMARERQIIGSKQVCRATFVDVSAMYLSDRC